MCGIAGFIDKSGFAHQEQVELIGRMCRVIEHRGPDDQGLFVESEVVLGMRRLSIIDLEGGHQPISNEDDTITVVFNGEIYNYRELISSLKSRGHQFKTTSDTETIVHAYEEYGEKCLDHLRGMFAFALWDSRLKKLFLARDRVGKKPLYYSLTRSGGFVFGSELKSLIQHPEIAVEINSEAIDAYLTFGYVPDPLSILRDVEKLPPGYYLVFADGKICLNQYWDFQYSTSEVRNESDYVEELRTLLEEAVRIRLRSDVPLGAFLSGGVDSAAVVALMARNMDQPVKTFSIGFHEDGYSELKFARRTAKHFNTEHHEFTVTADICQIIDDLVWYLDEPFADSSAIPTYYVSKLAREHVVVALSGDGGDELFAGYDRYAVDRKRRAFAHLPRLLRHGIMKPLSRRLPHSAWGRNFIYNVALDPIDRYLDSISVFTTLNKPTLYSPGFHDQVREQGGKAYPPNGYGNIATGEPLDHLLYIDSKTYLPGDILTKVDRMSMAVSLEVRAPLLDHKLIEFVTQIPASMKLNGHESKHIFKSALRNLLPAEIFSRPKHGFSLPVREWINHQLRERVHDTLLGSMAQRGYFDSGYVRKLIEEHERGRRDHSTALWALLMLELWHQRFTAESST